VKSILVDTGFLVAIYNRREPRHDACIRIHSELDGRLLTCEAVIMETLYLLRSLPLAQQAVLASISENILEVPFRLSSSANEVRELMQKYGDTPADFADACLIQMADEQNTGDILTLDSDFRHYRWRKTKHFRMLIPLD
jgi:uncharacterized protein